MEEAVLRYWSERDIFRKSVERRRGAKEYVFYDGPPFATGLPHFGHIVPGTIKDIVPRYQTMRGLRVERRFGWDCHGLPVEYEMEKGLGISGRTGIEEFGVGRFNEACRSIVLRYAGEWQRTMTRAGRWVDFENDYKTMDSSYMESIWWVVRALWDRGLIYRGYYILPTCPRCSTPLSNNELNLGGYRDVHDPAITVCFESLEEEGVFFLAWTTTPWTLVSNLALCVGPDIEYVKVESRGRCYVLARDLLEGFFPEEGERQIRWRGKGSELVGMRYRPLFPYFVHLESTGAFRVFEGEHVSMKEGTGIVHTAPGFGDEDYRVLRDTDIPVACPVDDEGRFTREVPEYQGIFVKDADKLVIRRLKEEGSLFRRDQILHSYPHCWRCESPIIYRAVRSWFVSVEKIKSGMLLSNAKVNWVPAYLREGRFGKWLENARDWAISRNRYWGNPLPVWECEDCGRLECLGSIAELLDKIGPEATAELRARSRSREGGWMQESGRSDGEGVGGEETDRDGIDLHKHCIDGLGWTCECGGTMKRTPEVLDCWFESGAMPMAQVHYPFENKEWFESHFPADFICEGLDQTRGWFYTLTVLAAAVFDSPAFRNVVVNGLVLAEDGKKMSKSLRNYTDPLDVMHSFGADALRLFLMNSPVVRAEGLRYSDEGVRDVLKAVLIPIWNAYSFFVSYANIDKVHVGSEPVRPSGFMDRWILSETSFLISRVQASLDACDVHQAITPILDYIDNLNNWYIRRSRRRFWKSNRDGKAIEDKKEAYYTLWSCLTTFCRVAAPIIPFITEEIYQNLRLAEEPESVHLCDWPDADRFERDEELVRKVSLARRVVGLGRALRKANDVKTRQPLLSVFIAMEDASDRRSLEGMKDIIGDELNCRAVVIEEDERVLVEYSAKANFRKLGPILGKDMKQAARCIEELSAEDTGRLLGGEGLVLSLPGTAVGEMELTVDMLDVRRIEREGLKVMNEGDLTVALDVRITPELYAEGMVRDLVRGIQNLRKESGLSLTDRIEIRLALLDSGERVQTGADKSDLGQAILAHYDYLLGETLGLMVQWLEPGDEAGIRAEGGDRKGSEGTGMNRKTESGQGTILHIGEHKLRVLLEKRT